MSKTPDEIVKALKCCGANLPCDYCPYFDECACDCMSSLNNDAAALIDSLQSQLAEREREIERLHRFKEYFDELYGQGLEVANWHLNGNTEPLDSFYDSAVEYMNDPLPAAPEEGDSSD